MLASASANGTIWLTDAEDGSLINTLVGHEQGVLSLSFSEDSTLLASGSADGTIKLWGVKQLYFTGRQDAGGPIKKENYP
jgi:WD40 repeat protein